MAEIKKEYAEALFSLAMEKDCLEEISEDLEQVTTVFAQVSDYTEFLCSPAIPMSQRLASVGEAFSGMHEYTVSFLQLLCENGFVRELNDCAREFFLLKKLHSNVLSARIISASVFTQEQKSELEQKLEAKFEKKIEASYECDPSLLGGFKVITDQAIIDATLRNQLEKVRGVIDQ